MLFVHKRWRKRPYAFYKSCRAMQDLQLWYSNVCPLQFKVLEKNHGQCRQAVMGFDSGTPERARRATVRWVRTPRPVLGSSVHAPLPGPLCHRPARLVCARRTSLPRRPTSGRAAVPRPTLSPYAHRAAPGWPLAVVVDSRTASPARARL
jgi:hypothetical protein